MFNKLKYKLKKDYKKLKIKNDRKRYAIHTRS